MIDKNILNLLQVEKGFSPAVVAGYLGDISSLPTNKKTKDWAVVGAAYGNKQGLVARLQIKTQTVQHT